VRIPRRAQDGLQRSWVGVVAKIRTRSGSGARVTVILPIIHSAGMAVKKLTARNKADLAVTPGPVPGTAHLVAKSADHRSAYEWQYSLDPKTWTAMPVTLQAKTDVSGLTSGTTYAFRFRPVSTAGAATWSQVVEPLIQ
jgi:hypothetical protein